MALDGAGNTYITGSFFGTVDFDPSANPANLTSAGNSADVFVAKYSSSGAYQWANAIGGTSGDDVGVGIGVDGSGDAYVTGSFFGTVDFDPSGSTANRSSAGARDVFVAKYSNSGDYQWANAIGGISDEEGRGIGVDGSGNAYVTGSFFGTVDFDPVGTANLTSADNFDAFVAKYSSSGAYQWANAIGGTSGDFGYGIGVDGSGNAYVTGSFMGTVDFDPVGTANLTSADNSADVFVAKYSSSGAYQWANAIGSTTNDEGYGIGVDGSGNAYVTGSFFGTVDFDPSDNTANLTSAGSIDVFVAKYSSSGAYQWANAIGGTSSAIGYGIGVDGSGNAYVTGYFQGTADFDPSGNTANLTSAGNTDIFVAKYGSSGAYQWANAIGGTNFDFGYGIAIRGNDDVYAVGLIDGSADVDPGPGTTNVTGGFLVRYANVIATTMPSAGTFCAGATVSVPFSITGNFNVGNVFTAQLSSAAGSFATPTAIGSLTSASAGTITATLPLTTAAGSGYRIRVVNDDPTTISSDNGTDLTVNPAPTVTLIVNNSATVMGTSIPTITVPPGPNQVFQVQGGTSYERVIVLDRINGYEIRQVDSNTTGFFPINRGLFTLTVTNGNGCSRTVQGILANP